MELERLAVALRPRNNWEALDLGLRLGVRHAGPLYLSWLAVALPIACVTFLVLGVILEQPAWAALLIWWLKPAFDRVAVHVIGHAVFGEVPTVRDTLHALPRLWLRTGLLRGLTLGRFSLRRSVTLPIDVLEGLRGKAARQRKSLITRRIAGAAAWQTLAWMHLETVFWLGAWALLLMLIPKELLPEWDWKDLFMGGKLPTWLYWCTYAPLWLASLLLEPLYVAGGFMLYIKRRTDLEAWDVELQFRRLNTRHREAGLAHTVALIPLVALCVTLLALSPRPAIAETESREHAVAEAPQALKTVLQRPEFGTEETRHHLRWIPDKDRAAASDWHLPDWLKALARPITEGLVKLGQLFASLGRIGGWLLLLIIAGLVLYVVSRFDWRSQRRRTLPIPAELAGFDIRPQSLPDDIPASALQLLRQGDARAALSLLFRASLSRLAHGEHVPFSRGDTEGDCLMRVRDHAPRRASFLARLLGCWQRLAYAHQAIAATEIESLCTDWGREFDTAGGRHV